MPATSKAQRRAMAIAEHHPDQLYARNRGLLSMSSAQLRDFAQTKEKKLPKHARHSSKHSNPHSGSRNRYGDMVRDKS